MKELEDVVTFTIFDSEKNEYKLSIDTLEIIENKDDYL